MSSNSAFENLINDYKETTIGGSSMEIPMSVISYRTKIDRKFLEKAAVQKLRYRSVNAFIDHAVEKALRDELGAGTPGKKIADEIARIVDQYYPLNFQAASTKEEREMLKDLEDLRSGKVKTVQAARHT